MLEILLKLLTNEQLLDVFQKVTRERQRVYWPPLPEEKEREKAGHLQHLHAQILSVGFERGLGAALVEGDEHVRRTLKSLADKNGGILPSE